MHIVTSNPRVKQKILARGISRLRVNRRQRRGAGTLDYVLTMGVALPLMGILYVAGPKMMNLVNQMTTVLVSWPFM